MRLKWVLVSVYIFFCHTGAAKDWRLQCMNSFLHTLHSVHITIANSLFCFFLFCLVLLLRHLLWAWGLSQGCWRRNRGQRDSFPFLCQFCKLLSREGRGWCWVSVVEGVIIHLVKSILQWEHRGETFSPKHLWVHIWAAGLTCHSCGKRQRKMVESTEKSTKIAVKREEADSKWLWCGQSWRVYAWHEKFEEVRKKWRSETLD